MTDINDLYEPGDDREPGEPEQEPPLTLEEIEAAHALTFDKSSSQDPYPAIELLLERAVPQMLAELREARERIAEFEALEKREEWSVTGGPDFPDVPGTPVFPADGALGYARRHETAQAWKRTLSVGPYEPISPDAPF